MQAAHFSVRSNAHRFVASIVVHPLAAIVAGAALSYVARVSLSAPLLVVAQSLILVGTRRATGAHWIVLFVATWVASFAAFRGAAHELSGGNIAFAVTMAAAALLGVGTLLLDRFVSARLHPLLRPLAYPAMRTPIEVASALLGPYGAWASMAALSAGSSVAALVVPVAGMFGVSFLFSWLASSIAEAAIAVLSGRARSALGALAPASAAVALVALVANAVPTRSAERRMTVAAVALPDEATGRAKEYDALVGGYRGGSEGAAVVLDAENARSLAAALRLIASAADKGARVVYVAETNVHVREERLAELENRVGSEARARQVWIGLGLGVILRGAEPNLRNEIVLFDPSGAVSARYEKSHAIGSETHDMVLGGGDVPVRSVYGARIAGIICFDSDFLGFTRRISREGVDVLFAPSNDWTEIAEMRGAITRYRALEMGATLVRPTSHGVSEIVAPDGHLLGIARYDATRGTVLVAEVPVAGSPTLYARLGDWPAPASLLLLCVLAATARRRAMQTEAIEAA